MRQAAVGGDGAGVKEFAAPADDEDEVARDDGRGGGGGRCGRGDTSAGGVGGGGGIGGGGGVGGSGGLGCRGEESGKGGDGEEAEFAVAGRGAVRSAAGRGAVRSAAGSGDVRINASEPAAGEVELDLFAGKAAGYVAQLAGRAHVAEPGKENEHRNHRGQHGASVRKRGRPERQDAGAGRAKPTNNTPRAGRYFRP